MIGWPAAASAEPSSTGILEADSFAKEPMDTVVKPIDGINVVYQYGKPVPAFDTWDSPEAARDYLSLDGMWKFAFDPQDQGLADGWQEQNFDDSSWASEKVPGSWDLYDTPGFGTYDGSRFGEGSAFRDGYAWYRTHLKPDANWKNRFVKLNFLGAGYKTWVYVNGEFVGAHEGGNTPFSLDVGDRLQPGKDNVIAVRVYRRPSFDTYTGPNPKPIRSQTELPPGPVDYWPYAGITRSVYLEASSQVTVSKLLTVAKDHRLRLAAVLYNHGEKEESRLVAADPGEGTGGGIQNREVTIGPGEAKVVSFDLPIPEAQPWDTATPNVYEASVALYKGNGEGQLQNGHGSVDDRLSVRYGMRTIEAANGKLMLNGRQIFLKGVNWHEETAASGRSMTKEEYDAELGLVTDLKANFIRNSVYNRHPYVYEYADKHGLLVMDDLDNMWVDTASIQTQTETYGLSRALALTMAWNQANDPSVILWSLQNESTIGSDPTAYRNWLADMKQAVKSVDLQNRPVTWASSSSWDPAFDLADVIGFNEYFGYFYMKDSDLGPTLDAVHRQYPDKPILITENGTWSIYGTHGSADTAGTEEWQANKFKLHWDQAVARKDFMAGYTFWNLKDYKERDNYNQSLNGISGMGLVTFDNEARRLVYYDFRDAVNPNP
ncbi:beta galactosidase jelly roll domain-containing protein [Cohnella sp. CBP 2801]|uniref:Beta galactosidase jelly roll domain-containing protein n=2 Tax=Cohnella zeiphila TaxID=2761120 RepID=A0A7X0SRJ9_9BACL|nr:beta galactosidase jelly roll domain-containing protein [Cohnella zeiphila]